MVLVLMKLSILSINQSSLAYAERRVAISGDHPVQVSIQASPNRKHRLAPAMKCVGAPLASSTPGYHFKRQPKTTDIPLLVSPQKSSNPTRQSPVLVLVPSQPSSATLLYTAQRLRRREFTP